MGAAGAEGRGGVHVKGGESYGVLGKHRKRRQNEDGEETEEVFFHGGESKGRLFEGFDEVEQVSHVRDTHAAFNAFGH